MKDIHISDNQPPTSNSQPLLPQNSFTIHHYASLGSTNDQLKAMNNAPEFTCVMADEQTAGRGRHHRRWHSSPGEGLYLSVLLCPPELSAYLPLLSLMAAIAVAETLIERGVCGVDIKWPNDVLINDRKVCGILIEGTGNRAPRIVLGIGVNLNHKTFPDEIQETATSLLIETGIETSSVDFREQLFERLARWYEIWLRGETELIVNRWQALSSFTRGCQVKVIRDEDVVVGETAGLTDLGALKIVTDEGELKTILAGEVMKLRRR